MKRVAVRGAKPDGDFYVVHLKQENYTAARDWCLDYPSNEFFYLFFYLEQDQTGFRTCAEFGFSSKEDQMLFALLWK